MISLADDRYIDEIFQDKITGKRRNIFVTFTAVAAALALVVGGISYFVSNAGNADKITADDPAVSELGIVDYSLYFQNTDESTMEADGDKGVLAEATGISCHFSDSEYVKSAMPFDMSRFVNAECQFFYDYKDEVRGIMIHADDSTEDKQENVKMLDVEVYERGELFSLLSLGKCKSMKRFDVDVYGFDFREEDNTVGVIFAMNGKEYLISGNYMSFDEIGIIMDSIIEKGLWTDSFDLSKAEMEYGDISADITLEEANMIMPFAGYVPQIHKFGDMRLNYNKVSYCAGRDEANNIVPQWLYLAYYDDGEQDICLQYFTEDADVQPLEKTVSIYDIELDKLSEYRDGDNHAFTVDYGGFKVNIWTNNCNDNELLNCLTAMRIGADGVVRNSFEEISLIEANNIVPYTGYVPQPESIGSMRVTSVYYEESSYNGSVEDNAVIVNLMDDNDKHMMLHYGNFKEKVRDKYVPLAEVYDRFESFSEQSQYNADCKQYSFTIDCGNFWIKVNADCTLEEMKMCLDEICRGGTANANLDNHFDFSPFGSLAEANKLEPFAGYVPNVKEIGDMKIYTGYGSEVRKGDSDEYGQILNISYQSEVTSGSTYGGNDFKAISVTYTEKKAYNIPEAPVILIAEAHITDIDKLKTDGIREGGRVCYRFVIDCGTCYITVAADCLPEEMKQFISEITGTDMQDADDEDEKILTIDKVKELAKKGDDLMWDDFDGYTFTEGGSGLYIRTYTVEEGYSLYIGGSSLYEKPMYIYLSGKGKGRIDIRYESVDEFLGEKVPLYAVDSENGNLLTIEKVKELAKKGEDLTWSDFEEFSGVDVGSGMYIMVYPVEDTDYRVTVGGSPDRKPMYIHFGKGDGNYIDLRKDSIDDFLS